MTKTCLFVLACLMTSCLGKEEAKKKMVNFAGKCPKVTSDDMKDYDQDMLLGPWRTIYGSDDFLGKHGDVTTEQWHGCANTSFYTDENDKTRINMVEGRVSGYQSYFCDAPKGTFDEKYEYDFDKCRRYLYDDKVLVFNQERPTSAVVRTAEKPDSDDGPVHTFDILLAKDYFSQNDYKMYDMVMTQRCQEKQIAVRADEDFARLLEPKTIAMYNFVNQIKENLKDNDKFLEFLVKLKEQPPSGHYDIINKDVTDKDQIEHIDQFKGFLKDEDKKLVKKLIGARKPNLAVWNHFRFFLSEETMFFHELDIQILAREPHIHRATFMNGSQVTLKQRDAAADSIENVMNLMTEGLVSNESHYRFSNVKRDCPFGDLNQIGLRTRHAALSINQADELAVTGSQTDDNLNIQRTYRISLISKNKLTDLEDRIVEQHVERDRFLKKQKEVNETEKKRLDEEIKVNDESQPKKTDEQKGSDTETASNQEGQGSATEKEVDKGVKSEVKEDL